MNALPTAFPEDGLPASVTVYEVGPRDGLQAEEQIIDTSTKVELIRSLAAGGLPAVEPRASSLRTGCPNSETPPTC